VVQKQDVKVPSGDSFIAGWLFLPDRVTVGVPAPAPAVAMAHGLGAVKEMHLEPFARRFAEAGVAAFVFDYRGFGASGGEPRQRVLPYEQIEDYRSALTWLSMQPQIDADRLGVWGSSFSGGHVLHLGAHDPRVKAVVSQVPATDIPREVRELFGLDAYDQIRSLIAQERIRRATEGGEVYVANAAPPDARGFALQKDEASYEFGNEAQKTIAPAWRNEVTLSSVEAIMEYAPARFIDLIAPRPLLLISADQDEHAPASWVREAFALAGEPKRLVELEGGHYSVYQGPNAQKAAAAAAAWFAAHLGVAAPSSAM
jgi:uncharacterized protein